MRWVLGWIFLVLVGCAEEDPSVSFSTTGIPLQIEATCLKEHVKLLEPFELKLTLRHGLGDDLDFAPAVPKGFSGEVRESRREEELEKTREYVLTLRALKLGELSIPPYTVKAGGDEASTDEILMQVDSILGEDADLATIEEPAPPFPPRVNYLPWVLGAGGLLLIVLFSVWLWRRPPKVFVPREVPLPAHVKALRALARLRGQPRVSEAEVEAFYLKVSQVLRVYLEERFGLHAPERTTEEFLGEIEQGDLLNADQRLSISRFLQQCDLVKFARLIPQSDVHEQTFRIAEAFVEQTRPDRVQGGAA